MSVADLKPSTIVREALEAVPVVRYALALAAIAILLAIVKTATDSVGISMFPLVAGMLLLMVLLIVVSAAAQDGKASSAAKFLIWVVVLFVTVFLGFTVSAVLIGKPDLWARIILPQSVIDKPLIAVGDVEDRHPHPNSKNKAENRSPGGVPVPKSAPSTSATRNANSYELEGANSEANQTVVPAAIGPRTNTKIAPAVDSNPLRGISVFYYPKGNDAETIRNALKNQGISFVERPPELLNPDLTSNAIACSSDVPVEALKVVFRAFREAGHPILSVRRFNSPLKTNRIEVLSVAYGESKATAIVPTNKPLSEEQLNSLNSCPVELLNE